jgi:hypothetical protein
MVLHIRWAPVATAWLVLGFRMEERPQAMEGSYEYVKETGAEKLQGVVLQLGDWTWGQQPLTLKNKLVTKVIKEPRTWTDTQDKRPRQWNTDMRFGLRNVRSLYRAGSLMTV